MRTAPTERIIVDLINLAPALVGSAILFFVARRERAK
jgi:hypothetical protein